MKTPATLRSPPDNSIEDASPKAGSPQGKPLTLYEIPVSPARQALADHLKSIAGLRAPADRAADIVESSLKQLATANQQLTAAEQRLASINTEHAATIRRAVVAGEAIDPTTPGDVVPAEAAVENARRFVASVSAALGDCTADHARAVALLNDATTMTDQFALAVMLEEHAFALQRRELLRKAFVAAETSVSALYQAVSEHGRDLPVDAPRRTAWLKAATDMGEAWGKLLRAEPMPKEIMAKAARWSGMLARLASDAMATE